MRNNSNIVNFYAKEYIRERLESSLDKFIDKQLIMVVAPSGYGKSTLVRHYFNDRPYYNKMWFPMQSKEKDDNWVWKRLCQKLGEYSERISPIIGILIHVSSWSTSISSGIPALSFPNII